MILIHACKLFKDCYKPYIYIDNEKSNKAWKSVQIPEEVAYNRKRYKPKTASKLAGTIPDVIKNFGINTLVFTIDNGIGSQEFRDSVLPLQYKLVKLNHSLKEKRLKSLKEAQVTLSQALNVKEALGELRKILLKQVKATWETRQRKAEEIVKMLTKSTIQSTETAKLVTLYDELKVSLGNINKDNELLQMVNAVGENVTYQRMLDDLDSLHEQGKHYSSDSAFYLDLLGCDCMGSLHGINI